MAYMTHNVNRNPKPDNYAKVGDPSSKEDGPIEITITAGHDAIDPPCHEETVFNYPWW